ncbi:MAG: S-adenosylmethionine synthetase N-terminal domain-containing protein, partial [Clostridia bacterium]|nr:S-adenosylmethionine synthetase N-terminal domain-containing protein [Clostridia bacterium]
MFEKVNPSHPDKVADRIAGAMVDIAYRNQKDPKVAVEVLIGHGNCHIIAESSYDFNNSRLSVVDAVRRIVG